jgi:hypothetical protein
MRINAGGCSRCIQRRADASRIIRSTDGPGSFGNLIFTGSRTDHRSGYATGDAAATPAGGIVDWWWVILLVIVAAVAIWYFMRRRTTL